MSAEKTTPSYTGDVSSTESFDYFIPTKHVAILFLLLAGLDIFEVILSSRQHYQDAQEQASTSSISSTGSVENQLSIVEKFDQLEESLDEESPSFLIGPNRYIDDYLNIYSVFEFSAVLLVGAFLLFKRPEARAFWKSKFIKCFVVLWSCQIAIKAIVLYFSVRSVFYDRRRDVVLQLLSAFEAGFPSGLILIGSLRPGNFRCVFEAVLEKVLVMGFYGALIFIFERMQNSILASRKKDQS